MKEERSGWVEEASRNSQRPSVAAVSSTDERLHNRIITSSRRTGKGTGTGEEGEANRYKVFNRCAGISENLTGSLSVLR